MTKLSTEEIKKCKADIVYYVETCCTANGAKIKLKESQKMLLRKLQIARLTNATVIYNARYGKAFCKELADKWSAFCNEHVDD